MRQVDWKSEENRPVTPRQLGTQVYKEYNVKDVVDYIDWNPFFQVSTTKKRKTTPFGVNLTRSLMIYYAAQKHHKCDAQHGTTVALLAHLSSAAVVMGVPHNKVAVLTAVMPAACSYRFCSHWLLSACSAGGTARPCLGPCKSCSTTVLHA